MLKREELYKSTEFRLFVTGYLISREGFNGEFPPLDLRTDITIRDSDVLDIHYIDSAVRSLSQVPFFVQLFSANTGYLVE